MGALLPELHLQAQDEQHHDLLNGPLVLSSRWSVSRKGGHMCGGVMPLVPFMCCLVRLLEGGGSNADVLGQALRASQVPVGAE